MWVNVNVNVNNPPLLLLYRLTKANLIDEAKFDGGAGGTDRRQTMPVDVSGIYLHNFKRP